MNIIELVQNMLLEFPKIEGDEIHIDYTDASPTNYGLSSTGDSLVSEDILGNQQRRHTFTFFAVFQSFSDYDRLSNSGVLFELAQWLPRQANEQAIEYELGTETVKGYLKKITCDNGMLFEIPNGTATDGYMYQMNITAEYKIESEEF